MTRLRASSFNRGFTLVEMVMVIAVTGILAAVVSVFIVKPVQGYVDTAARAELADTADLALRRMTRDLRLALPNSIRVTDDGTGGRYLELLLTKSGGRYLAEEDGVPGDYLKFDTTVDCASTPADCRFDVVGPMPDPAVAVNDLIVVYNLGPQLGPANAYDCTASEGCNRARVSAVDAALGRITLASNPFASQATPMRSPNSRFQVVSTPVTYVCRDNALVRYWGYTISPAQPASAAALAQAGARQALLAQGVSACSFDYNQLANTRNSLVGLTLGLSVPGTNAGTVMLYQQVHVDNTP